MRRTLVVLAIAAAALYLPLVGLLPYPGGAILKTTMCVALAGLAVLYRYRLLAVALLFSAAGDALLAIDGARLFLPALASFLVTHVLYAVIFLRESRVDPAVITYWRRIGMRVPVVFAMGYAVVLWPHLGPLAVPVLIYIGAIVVMTVLSFRIPAKMVTVGAGLFMVSDSLIALGKFLWLASWLGPIVWITYAAAQLLISYGLLTSPRAGGEGSSTRRRLDELS